MNIGRIAFGIALLGLALLGWTPAASAHGNNSLAYSDLVYEDDAICYTLQIDLYDLRAIVTPDDPDIESETPEAVNRFFATAGPKVEEALLPHLRLYADGLPLRGKLVSLRGIAKEGETQAFAEAVLSYPANRPPAQFALDYDFVFDNDQWHVNYVNVSLGRLQGTGVLVSQLRELQLGRMSLAEAFERYSLLGLKSWLTGFASLLFAAVLLLSGRPLRQAMTAVAAFAGAGTLALILTAGLQAAVLPERFVGAVCALSVFGVALHGLLSAGPRSRIWLAGGCGLVHGLGFAQTLSGMRVDAELAAASLTSYGFGLAVGLTLLALVLYPAFRYASRLKRFAPTLLSVIALVGLAGFLSVAYR
ncbi:HupE/UreJ family protein [Cohnella sp. REN36]|uniref:HupE/UreJ family protein n=1 Tax=Cohnella sp. REN36 TaxID=2887347 RepID=UPI001D1385C1|nr:HupE/UreJ family protein [Cohnella sp. REN36]